MPFDGTVPKHVESIKWQDYRGSDTGMVVFYTSDPVSELPIREVPEEMPSEVIPEPNYETGTYGLYGCQRPKIRSMFAKSKLRYLFFMTKYAGTKIEHMDEIMVTGFYRINQTANVQKLHMRYLNDYGCISDESCLALRADEVRFVSADDGFVLTEEVLASWEYSSRVTKQTRIVLDEMKSLQLAEYLRSKEDRTEEIIEETKRLAPAIDDDDEEDDEESTVEATAENPGESA